MQYIPFILLAKYKETPRVFEEKKIDFVPILSHSCNVAPKKARISVACALYFSYNLSFEPIWQHSFFFLAVQGVQYWLQMPAERDMKVKYYSEVDIKKIKTH